MRFLSMKEDRRPVKGSRGPVFTAKPGCDYNEPILRIPESRHCIPSIDRYFFPASLWRFLARIRYFLPLIPRFVAKSHGKKGPNLETGYVILLRKIFVGIAICDMENNRIDVSCFWRKMHREHCRDFFQILDRI